MSTIGIYSISSHTEVHFTRICDMFIGSQSQGYVNCNVTSTSINVSYMDNKTDTYTFVTKQFDNKMYVRLCKGMYSRKKHMISTVWGELMGTGFDGRYNIIFGRYFRDILREN